MIRGVELLKKAGYEGFKMAKKVKLGDILQVLTSQGVAYAQVTHKHPEFGFLIRVLPEFHNEQPKDFSVVVYGEPQFSAFLLFKVR